MSGDHPLDMPTRRFPRAACLGQTDTFFPSNIEELFDRAKAIRAACPVRQKCLDANLHETVGIWGGMGEDDIRSSPVDRDGAPHHEDTYPECEDLAP